MRARTARAYGLLFFLSGATGLVYELLWMRLLYQAFGSTIQSVTTVVAAFMGGLGLGAWWLGRRADSHPRPAALYGWLEVAIGVFGVLSPFVLALAHRGYLALAEAWPLGGGASVALRFGLAALVLLVPTTLMGGTLPVLTRAFTGTDRIGLQTAVSRLYGLNTLGAMTGTALAGFFLIEHAGIRTSLWATAATNVMLGAAAITLARPLDPVPSPAPSVQRSAGRPASHWLYGAAFALLAGTAFSSLLAEIAWTRVLVMIVAGSTYAFTLILLVFLLGMGSGSWLVARRGRSPRRTAAEAALAQAIVTLGCALVLASVSRLPGYIVRVFQPAELGATARLALLGGAVSIVVLVPAVGMGMTFPLLTELVSGEGEARSADVGRAYAFNTVGGIAGAVLTGFVLIAGWGTHATLRLGVLVSAAATLVLAVGGAEGHGVRPRVLGPAFLTGIGLIAAVLAPRWDTALLDLGPAIYGRGLTDSIARRTFLEHRGSRQVAFVEGRNATVSVWESPVGRSLKVNGKVDASDYGDMDTQVMLGVAPLAARPAARSALVIGYGSGVTARVVAATPGVARVRVLEIEPAVLAMSPFFTSVNDSVLARRTVTVVTDDARSALQLDQARYDVVISEPSNPWFAGVATLYTPEFFRIAHARLSEDGVFCQWVQTYQLPLGVVASIVRNLRSVFPYTEVWFGGLADVIVLGSSRPFRYDPGSLGQLLGPHGALGDLGREYLGVDDPADYFGRRLLGDSGSARLAALATVVHSDDRPQLEFVAARRFLDMGRETPAFDSLIALGPAAPGSDPRQMLALAKVLSRHRWDAAALPYIDAARRLEPDAPYWTVQRAGMLLTLGHATFADTALSRLAARRDPDALLLMGILALSRNDVGGAKLLLERALAAGADTAETSAHLALVAAREGSWTEAAARARTALGAARGTLRHPYPARGLTETFSRMAMSGPPKIAEELLAEAAARQPNSVVVHERYAIAALRAGDCATGLAQLSELPQFGFHRPDGPSLVERCRRGEAF